MPWLALVIVLKPAHSDTVCNASNYKLKAQIPHQSAAHSIRLHDNISDTPTPTVTFAKTMS